MVNFRPTHCPYCGTELVDVEPPTYYRCEACDDYVFYNPTPGGSVAVVDGESLLLVEDFRTTDRWKLPSGAVEAGESMRAGAIRELEEETGLMVDPDDLAFMHDSASQPVSGKYMTNVSFSTTRAATTGSLEAGDDATDARFFRPEEFEAGPHAFTDAHVDRFGTDSLEWLLETARASPAGTQPTP